MKKIFYEVMEASYELYETTLATKNCSLEAYDEVREELDNYVGQLRFVRNAEFAKDLYENFDWFEEHKQFRDFLMHYFKYRGLHNMSI